MSYIRICDLCGEPLPYDGSEKKYKVKEYRRDLFGQEWVTIDVHASCVRKLLNACGKAGEGEA